MKDPEKNSTAVSIEKTKREPYSARNRSVKPREVYSVLIPDTNSDSPSAKSKGARKHSARRTINHNGIRMKSNGWKEENHCKERRCITKTSNRMNKSTSYETLWHADRTQPSKGYLLRE